jgi:hypothetical protein
MTRIVPTRLLIGALLASMLLTAPAGVRAHTVNAPPNNARDHQSNQIDLSGVWKNDDGDKLALVQKGTSVTTTFIGDGSCPDGSARSFYIQGTLSGNTLTGTMQRCTQNVSLLHRCNLTDPWNPPFKATITQNSISGTFHSQYYILDTDSKGNPAGCHEDPSQAPDDPFSMSIMPCDPDAVAKYIAALANSDAQLGAADADTFSAEGQLDHMLVDYGDDAAKLGPVKLALKKALDAKLYGDAHTVVVGGLEVSAMLYTYYWEISTFYPFMNQRLKLQEDAQSHVDNAAQIFNSALQDADTAIAQLPECKREADRLHQQSQFKDDLRSTIDGWENNGFLYIDPNDPSRTPLSEQAALKRAAQALGVKVAPLSAHVVGMGAPASKDYRVTKAQVKKALRYLNIALGIVQPTKKWMKHKLKLGKSFRTALASIRKHVTDEAKSFGG